ncbi:outer membrane beta-barrel protein [Euzebyella saccharophila]|uniref:Outer membrane beta-barrel protein n=1 Tax=Euzebyella saccharophila TaxID=679664 RepID=A0ABV8JMT7_9FLAO|nr:outer membrane beta-barrel protein [Euzebyella saccharophila]
MSKKNLDSLYQEKFKGFKEVPDEAVWQKIEASLDKRTKKHVIPLWWKLGGIAAALILGFLVFRPSSIPSDTIPTVSNTKGEPNNYDNSENENQLNTDNEINTAVVEANTDKEDESKNANVIDREVTTSSGTTNRDKIQKSIVPKKEEGITARSKFGKSNNTKESGNTLFQPQEKKESDATISKLATNFEPENANLENNVISKNEKSLENQNSDNSEFSRSNMENNALAAEDTEELKPSAQDKESKKSILDAIAEQNKEDVEVVESTEGRWSVGPSVAPVYFDAVGEGSPIHSAFNQNTKSGNTNLSYGVSVAYQVNKKFKVRSGIHKVNFGYDTDNVAFASSLDASSSKKISNINYSQSAKNIIVNSETATFSSLSSPLEELAMEVRDANDFSRTGAMAQQLGYLEVPLELDYSLIDKKIGLNLVGGFSSLFLLDNSVTLTSGDLTTEVGEANNINEVNFSTNVGFGVNYKFTPMIQLNVEPVFKYQLNTFSEVSGDFRPFSVGVYSGLNFKF